MKTSRDRTIMLSAAGLIFVLSTGCRPEPGTPDYESQETFRFDSDGSGAGALGLPGPEPFLPGQERLTIGAFYEGESSVAVPIDEVTTHLYVYESTLSIFADDDRIEGVISDVISLNGTPWWGFGIHWDNSRSLTDWTTLHASFRSSSPAFATFEIAMNDAIGTNSVQASDYGWVNDGEWHTLRIPLTDLAAAGVDLSAVAAPFVLLGGAGPVGERMSVDDVFFSAL